MQEEVESDLFIMLQVFQSRIFRHNLMMMKMTMEMKSVNLMKLMMNLLMILIRMIMVKPANMVCL